MRASIIGLLVLVAGCSAAPQGPAPEESPAVAAPAPGESPAPATRSGAAVDFWDRPRRGGNSQNVTVERGYWRAAADAGLEFVRLMPDAWEGRRRDFLIGDADDFRGLVEEDVDRLVEALDEADTAGVRVVLAMLSLPGARWRQLGGGRDDDRLWRQAGFQGQAAEFWRQLAGRLRGHPAIVAYNPLNEPHPERSFGFEAPTDQGYVAWREQVRGTPADLDAFHRAMVDAIRASDPDTPILLDGGFHASVEGLAELAPVDDPGVLYAFHVYTPWEYTTFRVNDGRFRYPDAMPAAEGDTRAWSRGEHGRLLEPVAGWARRHGVSASRIVASEFGVDRRVAGAREYLEDLIAALNERGWHWAFYAFRSDDWDGLDYELGTGPMGAAYWEAVERGVDPEILKRRGPNPLWNVIARELLPRSR